MSRICNSNGAPATDLFEVFEQVPEVSPHLFAILSAMRTTGTLPLRLLELARLRIAFFNQCRICMSTRYEGAIENGLTEDAVCSLERPADAENLTEPEKLAVEYAERFATNHLSLDDAFYARLRKHFTNAEVVQLGINCALNTGIGRLVASWDLVESLPEATPDKQGRYAPWSTGTFIAPESTLLDHSR